MTERIRWERIDGTVTSWFGYVGSHKGPLFQILHPVATKPDSRTQFHKWALAATFAQDEVRYPETSEGAQAALKDEAEDWLAGFVSSLGAVFPEPPKPDPDCEECGFGLPRHDKDCSHYAMTCKHCKKPIIRCDVLPSHFGCSSAYGYIHDNPRAHACEPRSDGPYAQPESDHA